MALHWCHRQLLPQLANIVCVLFYAMWTLVYLPNPPPTRYTHDLIPPKPCSDNHDCMYLHELGDDAVSYSKEDMLAGRHVQDVNVTFEQQHQAQTQVAAQQAAAKAAAAPMRAAEAPLLAWAGGPTPGEAAAVTVAPTPTEQAQRKKKRQQQRQLETSATATAIAEEGAAAKGPQDPPLSRTQRKALLRRQQQEAQQRRLLAQQQRAEQHDEAEAAAAAGGYSPEATAASASPSPSPSPSPSSEAEADAEDWPTLGRVSAGSVAVPTPVSETGWSSVAAKPSAPPGSDIASPSTPGGLPSGLISLGPLPRSASGPPSSSPRPLGAPFDLPAEGSAAGGVSSLQTLQLGTSVSVVLPAFSAAIVPA